MEFTKENKRKYAMGVSRLKLGIWGEKRTKFFKLHLTTKAGEDNSQKRFSDDFRKLIRWMRTYHKELEYCGATGYTPKSELLHGHFIIRIKGGVLKLYDGETLNIKDKWMGNDGEWHSEHDNKNRVQIGDKWNEIHGAFVVGLPTGFPKQSDFVEYITKHIMKDYARDKMLENRFLVSRGWSKFNNNVKLKFKELWTSVHNEWMHKNGYEIYRLLQYAVCSKSTVEVYLDKEKKGVVRVRNGEIKMMGVYNEKLDSYETIESILRRKEIENRI